MNLKITEQVAKSENPTEYANIIKNKKFKDITNGDWSYNFGVMIGGIIDLKSEQDFIDHYQKTHIISLAYSSGRKSVAEKIEKLPLTFINMAKDEYIKKINDVNIKQTMINNFASVHQKMGSTFNYSEPPKSAGVMNGLEMMNHLVDLQKWQSPNYPDLSEIEQYFPEVIEKYKKLATGDVIIIFNPAHKLCDEWGFVFNKINLATKRDNVVRFVDDCSAYIIENDHATWIGGLASLDKAKNATEGTDFVGWKRTKQYRLTKTEISNILKGNIYKDGGIKF